jgi:hypothetical protein
MKKFLTFGLGAVMAMCAISCSQDDELSATEPQGFVSENGEAYVNVRITAPADVMTRAETQVTDEGFSYGETAEQTIKSARFFFFDKDGKFIKEGLIYSDGGGESNKNTPTENVEYIDKKLVLLVNVGSNTPAYVITVANPPADLDQKIGGTNTIANVENILEDNYYVEGESNGVKSKNFIMTTTSYLHSDATGNEKGYYYVTPITGGVFSSAKEAQAAGAAVLNIYIERLAVKVGVNINEGSATLKKGNATVDNTYQLLDEDGKDVTIVGDSSNEPVYVQLLGWGLNATTRQNYLFKHIDTSWSKEIDGFEWNDEKNYRSYWGKSFNYGLADFNYPQNYHTNVDVTTTTSAPWLTYIPANDIDNAFGSVDYCMENTNTADILKKHYNSAATAVLVKARIVKKDGTNYSQNIVKFGKTLYTYKGYAAYVLSTLSGANGMNYYSGGTKIAESDLTVASAENKLNGRVYVQLTDDAARKSWSDAAENGNAVTAEAINDALAAFNLSSDALGYVEGLMYYSIPIRHLGAIGYDDVEGNYSSSLFETYLGVVRNHYYILKINSLSGVGHGIVKPGEPIVPNPVEDTGYYLNAKINVLSWKVVGQSVDLGTYK